VLALDFAATLLPPDFPFWYNAIVTNVVDGDTVDATLKLGLHIETKERFRLYGINAYELTDKDPENRKKAQQGKDYVTSKVFYSGLIKLPHNTSLSQREAVARVLNDLMLGRFLMTSSDVSIENISVTGTVFQTHQDKIDKYGRWLAVIYYFSDDSWHNLNQELVDLGLAVPYMV
jgi:endonuclease YncB( thermonuclease family)